jgi:RNase P/RNase MRP subunit p29
MSRAVKIVVNTGPIQLGIQGRYVLKNKMLVSQMMGKKAMVMRRMAVWQ